MFRRIAVVIATALVITGVSAAPSVAAPPGDDLPAVYEGTVDEKGLAAIIALGVDRHDVAATPTEDGVDVEVILGTSQAEELAAKGIELEAKEVAAPQQRLRLFSEPTGVFRTYGGAGGIQEELQQQASDHPGIAEYVVFGQTVNGTDIAAVRVTKNPAKAKPGDRPTTVFAAAQHAREWITPEMVRRLLDEVVSGYGTDARITELVDTTEMWFIPVANPDGYDFTHEDPANRLWRKNLREINGVDGIQGGDGVDLNRNYPTRWGYDNEGSSPNPSSETYRGPEPASEPETQALIGLFEELTPEFFINYHSAAELLLYGIGWQVSTPSPDDVIYEAMVGDDANPAVEGYDPDISAELYTTNGDTDTHLQAAFGTLGFTPELSTCQTVSDAYPDDEWEASACQSGFNFPDDEELIQEEFEKNLPFALAVAESALDPDDPVSVVGLDAADFVVDSFDVSYGDPQTVAVTAKRALKAKKMWFSINGGEPVDQKVAEWTGGERYGFENADYYAEYRGVVSGASPGDEVEVWFTGTATAADVGAGNAGPVESEHFTYVLEEDSDAPVLVLANEDYTGVNPTYTGVTAPKYADAHADALAANGVASATWDVDAQGVPHPLGVLSHFDAAIWYTGDNRLTQDLEDFITSTPFGPLPDSSVAERQQYLTLAVRDWLNEGGKLATAGETAQWYGFINDIGLGGIYYGLNGDPSADCVVESDFFGDCLILADDFAQYWLGGYARFDAGAQEGATGIAPPFEGLDVAFGGPAVADNPIDEAGQFVATSDVLPVSDFPDFASEAVATYADPYAPVEGDYLALAAHVDDGYQRLARTFDLTALAPGDAPRFEAQIGFNVENSYDNVIVEVHTVGADDWTTLPDANGNTSTATPAECFAGFLLDEHPFLEHYVTLGIPCLPNGDTGDWNAMTGVTDGFVDVSFDLSAYAGSEIELVVSYVTDPAFGGLGVVLDDTKLVTGVDTVTEAEGFETGLGAWSVPGAPAGSPGNFGDWERSMGFAPIGAVVATDHSLLFGFGLEQLATDEARNEVVGDILSYFGL
ncbi:zinc carboxypeptidase [Agromyces rhizosphaerae]|uniref:Zinc carboxypeptidase n=1 Tax=Agromyces rhizosphaerae TaxID=88374 RepID=A0A9W6FPP4_9MICO|nr:M14 family metallopeptidase [Agromyces rhizosphaerae]GLI27736.1 zinc carboxypeptidase [Agromyces rhizosphaerae]